MPDSVVFHAIATHYQISPVEVKGWPLYDRIAYLSLIKYQLEGEEYQRAIQRQQSRATMGGDDDTSSQARTDRARDRGEGNSSSSPSPDGDDWEEFYRKA